MPLRQPQISQEENYKAFHAVCEDKGTIAQKRGNLNDALRDAQEYLDRAGNSDLQVAVIPIKVSGSFELMAINSFQAVCQEDGPVGPPQNSLSKAYEDYFRHLRQRGNGDHVIEVIVTQR